MKTHTVGRLASLWYQIGVPREAQRGDNASICALLVAGGHAHGVPDEQPAACAAINLGKQRRSRNENHQKQNNPMKAKKIQQFRQGDVLIQQIVKVPTDANIKRQKKSNRIILAHGTATGHHHTLGTLAPAAWSKLGEIPSTSAKASTLAGEVYVKLSAGGTVTHQEHAAITLPAGNYRITRQREYSPEAIRNVAD